VSYIFNKLIGGNSVRIKMSSGCELSIALLCAAAAGRDRPQKIFGSSKISPLLKTIHKATVAVNTSTKNVP
jgi:hypothetical protein